MLSAGHVNSMKMLLDITHFLYDKKYKLDLNMSHSMSNRYEAPSCKTGQVQKNKFPCYLTSVHFGRFSTILQFLELKKKSSQVHVLGIKTGQVQTCFLHNTDNIRQKKADSMSFELSSIRLSRGLLVGFI